jgi:hypothetical protein
MELKNVFFRYYKFSVIVSLLALLLAFYIKGWEGLYLVLILAILEISMSFDNAIVNARVLAEMPPIWRKRFLTWGIIIAVFIVRFLIPVLIVSMASSLSLTEALKLAITNPVVYKEILEKNAALIYAFGGAFLLMVFLKFFFDVDRKEKWIKPLEANKLVEIFSKVEAAELIIATAVGLLLTWLTKDWHISFSYFLGIFLYSIIVAIDESLSHIGGKTAIANFLYLELLDASFSLDGVIGAFAITLNIVLITLGLAIGAVFVRSITIHISETGVLVKYKYLEHGAHYAILILAIMMFIQIFHHIPEVIIGTIGAIIVGLSFIYSKYQKDHKL